MKIVKLLSCYAPHLGEECGKKLGHDQFIAYEPWPTYDESVLVEENAIIVVQVKTEKFVVNLMFQLEHRKMN